MSSQDSVIVLSEDEEEAEEYLKIYYQDSKRFIEIPLESNGKVLSKDITRMDSRISALIIEKKDFKRMVKFKDGYVKEPKETWKNVKVYALLEGNQEVKSNRITSAENSYHVVTGNSITQIIIKSETPTALTQEIQNNNHPGITVSLPSSPNVCVKQNKVKVEAREMSSTMQQTDHKFNLPVPSSTITRHSDNSSPNLTAAADDDECNSDVEKSSSDGVVINSYHNVTDNWNTRISIKSETLTVLTEEIQNNNQTGITISLPSLSNVLNKVKVEAREMSTTVQHTNRPIPSSTVARNNNNSSEDKAVVTDDDLDVENISSHDNVTAIVKPFCSIEENIEPANCNMPVKEPTNDELLLAYKVSSLKELKVKICRGDFKYYTTFHAVRNRFKRTMVAYPNNEFVRLVYWVKRTNIKMKKLDPSANDVCVLCDEDFTLKHLVSERHADMYHQKFNADPPDVAFILNPQIYEQYLDPSVLAELKIPEFIKLEESPQFLTTGNEFVLLKYIIINRLLQGTLVMDMRNFSFDKIVFIRNNSNHSSLQTVFQTENLMCIGCKKYPIKSLRHILSGKHLRKFLNQKEMNNICKAISLVKNTPNGYCFESEIVMETKRKRKQSSNNIQNGIKREKNS